MPQDPIIDKATLEKIVAAAKLQIELEQKLDALAEEESRLNMELAEVAGGWRYENGKGHPVEGLIPKLLEEADVKSIVLGGGMIVKVEDELKCPSMAADSDKKEPVLNWLDKSGNSKVIKDYIAIPFEKGQQEKVTLLLEFLKTIEIIAERYRSVHPGTLKKLINEIIATPKKPREDFASDQEYQDWLRQNDVPMDELGVQEYKRSKIVVPKEKKK